MKWFVDSLSMAIAIQRVRNMRAIRAYHLHINNRDMHNGGRAFIHLKEVDVK